MKYNTLENFYEMMFSLEFNHKYSEETINNWIIYERDIYVAKIMNYLRVLEQERLKNNVG